MKQVEHRWKSSEYYNDSTNYSLHTFKNISFRNVLYGNNWSIKSEWMVVGGYPWHTPQPSTLISGTRDPAFGWVRRARSWTLTPRLDLTTGCCWITELLVGYLFQVNKIYPLFHFYLTGWCIVHLYAICKSNRNWATIILTVMTLTCRNAQPYVLTTL